MKDKKEDENKEKAKSKSNGAIGSATDALFLHSEFEKVRKQIEQIRETSEQSDQRLDDIEVHLNLLTRFLTTLCVEKFGMRVGVLKRLIKRVEKEAIRDSQISHLESLYNLSHRPNKKGPPPSPRSKSDPWDEIS